MTLMISGVTAEAQLHVPNTSEAPRAAPCCGYGVKPQYQTNAVDL